MKSRLLLCRESAKVLKPLDAGTCAVTGASGYVGSVIVRELAKSMPIVGLGRKPRRANDVLWSLESSAALDLSGVGTLVHAAWDLHCRDSREGEQICVRGSEALFSAAERAGVGRIVFISSISAFESCRSVYGKTKLAVEKMLSGKGRVILRPGLVYGQHSGGMFGALRRQVQASSLLPIIGDGRTPQYLLDEKTLAESVRRAVLGEFDDVDGPITIANPHPVPFRKLLEEIAREQNREVTLIPVPWRLMWAALRGGEMLHLRLPFQSDSIISFVHQNPRPDFSRMQSLGIAPEKYPFLP